MPARIGAMAEVISRIYASTRPEGGCLVTTRGKDTSGYGVQGFQGKVYRAHQLVARYYLGPCPEGMEIRHLCGRGASGCVTASHLRYGTRSENQRDAYRHGRSQAGRRNGNAKLSEQDVIAIRSALGEGRMSGAEAGRHFGVGKSQISRIKRGESWSGTLRGGV